MQRNWIAIGLGMLLLTPAGGGAAGPSDAHDEPGWDDSHMQSRYRSVLAVESAPVEVRGSDRYAEIAHSPQQRATLRVPETLSFSTQRPWESGPVGASSRTQSPSSGTWSRGAVATRHRGTPGARSTAAAAGSAFRSSSRSTSRSR